jgi:hypothetical protein
MMLANWNNLGWDVSFDGDVAQEYGMIADSIAPGIVQQAQAIRVAGEDWISAITRAISTVSMADAQRRLLNLQLQRAQQGLPPLDSSQYGLGVSVGIGGDTQKMILLGLAGIAVVLLLTRSRR